MQYPSGRQRDVRLRQSANKLGQHTNLQRGRKEGEQKEHLGQPHSRAGHRVRCPRDFWPHGLRFSERKIHFSIRSNNKNIMLIESVQSGLTYSLP